ncbi:RNase adapter RapZ [Qipengyuania sp. DSG2-2]|uniref:RNase adapter RapZ n=1 Tax=Qipengyuania sp. DGS2-2 TaxID=3349631 RepID=UPI0036D2CD4C
MAEDSPSDSAHHRQRVLLVTGMSGAGKTTALHVLEDLGWEAIDNFPIRLLERLVSEPQQGSEPPPLAIGFDTRTRGFVPADIMRTVERLSRRADLEVASLFIDCSSGELERRYNETRRRHPLAKGRSALDGIMAERELLSPLRQWANVIIDTSELATNELQQAVRERFSEDAPQSLSITVSSFGYARGMPPLADLVFDMRFLDNPHWEPELREQTGQDAPVAEYIAAQSAFTETFAKVSDLVLDLLPRYRAQGRAYLHIAFGCTGGRHRSVFSAEQMAQVLREAGFSPTLLHRNIQSRAADQIERAQH